MESLFSNETNLNYPNRLKLLENHNIAVWDVLKNCVRSGSMDSSIEKHSMIANDFNAFYTTYPTIKSVFFNGTKSETEYKKQVIPDLPPKFAQLKSIRLPSTSPAMATLKPLEKLKHWAIIKTCLNDMI